MGRSVGISMPTVEAFLGHKTGGGSKTNYLDKWKDRKPPVVDTFMHCHCPMVAIWSHSWPRIVEKEFNGQKTLEVWSGRYNSWEPEDVLKAQRFRDRDTGERKVPPTICPMSLFLEAVWQAIQADQINITTKLFEFVGDDPKKAKVLHAGGLVGMFNDKTPDADKALMTKAGISMKTAWQENMLAKCSYIVQVVDVDEVEKGIQVATLSTLLGEKIKSLIGDRMTAAGPEKGHPFKNPYCIRWQHLPLEAQFDKKYKALWMEQIEATEEILDLIQNSQPADISRQLEAGNITELRQSFETHYVGPEGLFDWDEIFAAAEEDEKAAEEEAKKAAPAAAVAPKVVPKPQVAAAAKPAPKVAAAAAAKPKATPARKPAVVEPEPEPEAEAEPEAAAEAEAEPEYTCDDCNAPMTVDELVCKGCGRDYSPEPAPVVAPPKKSRSSATPTTAAAGQKPAAGSKRVAF